MSRGSLQNTTERGAARRIKQDDGVRLRQAQIERAREIAIHHPALALGQRRDRCPKAIRIGLSPPGLPIVPFKMDRFDSQRVGKSVCHRRLPRSRRSEDQHTLHGRSSRHYCPSFPIGSMQGPERIPKRGGEGKTPDAVQPSPGASRHPFPPRERERSCVVLPSPEAGEGLGVRAYNETPPAIYRRGSIVRC